MEEIDRQRGRTGALDCEGFGEETYDTLCEHVYPGSHGIARRKERTPLAFCTLCIDFICALCCLSAFMHYGFILMSQKNPETESVRDQQ